MLKFNKQAVWDGKNFIINADTINAFNNWYFKQNTVDDRYKHDEEILMYFVPKLINPDSKLNDIYLLVTLINAFYGTRMGNDYCYALSELLHKNHKTILKTIESGNISEIQNIIEKQKTSLNRVEFSFTTKYFSLLCRYTQKCDKFPIYDSVVSKMLDYYFYANGVKNKTFVSGMRKDYVNYYDCINKLINKSDIEYKKLDTYLWWLGRNVISEYDNHGYNPKNFCASCDYKIIDKLLTNTFNKK